MKNILLKTLILIGHVLVFLVFIEIMLLGRYYNTQLQDNYILIINLLLNTAIVIFAFFYTISLSESYDQNLPFISIYLFLLQISLIAFEDSNLIIFDLVSISQITISGIILFCAIGMNLMLSGYGLFSQKKSRETINDFLFTTLISTLAISILMPKVQGVFNFWEESSIAAIFSLFSVINLIIFIVLLVTDPIGTQTIRNVFGLILTLFTWLFFSFNSKTVCISGVSFLIVSFIAVTILCRRYSAKL